MPLTPYPGSWALKYHTLILFLKGTIMKYKFILFLPGYFKAAAFGYLKGQGI